MSMLNHNAAWSQPWHHARLCHAVHDHGTMSHQLPWHPMVQHVTQCCSMFQRLATLQHHGNNVYGRQWCNMVTCPAIVQQRLIMCSHQEHGDHGPSW